MELKGYTNIPDWMLVFDIDIYETIILAVIYGFSQDKESTFAGSQNYLAKKARCSRSKVARSLLHLLEYGLIDKIDKDVRGVHLCEYRVTPLCTTYTTCVPHAWGCVPETHNNIVDNINIKIDSNKREAFKKPSVEEVADYCKTRNNGIDPEEFIAHYESNGWMVGKTKMKDWKSAIITWEKSRKRTSGNRPPHKEKESVLAHNLKVMDEMFGTDYYKNAYGKKEVDVDEQ